MRFIAACVATLFLTFPAHAGYVFDNGQVRVQFADTACEHPRIAEALAQFGKSKKATVFFQGQVFQACWLKDGDDFFIVDETGGYGTISGREVKIAKDA